MDDAIAIDLLRRELETLRVYMRDMASDYRRLDRLIEARGGVRCEQCARIFPGKRAYTMKVRRGQSLCDRCFSQFKYGENTIRNRRSEAFQKVERTPCRSEEFA